MAILLLVEIYIYSKNKHIYIYKLYLVYISLLRIICTIKSEDIEMIQVQHYCFSHLAIKGYFNFLFKIATTTAMTDFCHLDSVV